MKNKITFLFTLFLSIVLYGQNTVTISYLKQALRAEANDSIKISLNVKLSNSFSSLEKDSSNYYFKNALLLADSILYKKQLAKILDNEGFNFEIENNFEKAILNFERSLAIYIELNDNKNMARLYNYIGYCYINLYAEDKAIEYYLKSLKIYQSIDDAEGKAMNFIDIGNLYYDQENYENAKKYFQDALTLYEKLGDNEGIAASYTNLGNVYCDSGVYDEGIDYYKQSIILEEELNDQNGIATNYNNLGDCNIQLSNFNEAKVYFQKGLNIATKIKDQELIAIIYLNMADLYEKQKKYNQTIFYAKKSLDISRKIGKLDFELDNLKFLADAYEAIGETTEALKVYKQHDVVKDSLYSYDKDKKVQLFNALNKLEETYYTISDLSSKNEIAQLKYKNEKKISYFLIIAIVVFAFLLVLLIHQQTSKKKAYNLLEFRNFQINKMNDEIQEQRDYLNQLNKTKDKFFSIIAHDLKNPFNSIKGFTELLIDNSGEYEEEKQLKFLKIIKDSTIKASMLLNNLLIWANSQSGNLTYIPKKIELVRQVMDVTSLLEIQAIKKEIEIYNNVDHNLSVKADENMLNTILRNLISNAIKFTNPKGEIRVLSKVQNDMVEISITDNGVGISNEDIENVFNIEVKNTNIGTANEQGSGLGLILCKDFVEKHGGKIWVNSEINVGTEFIFTLPLWSEEADDKEFEL
ncbi:Signal transduction histidine kinase [Lutibacter agarilyticus]|uniref:histidine kinase n=1 Tax=Lutibacter agarilyticus TaxID=1109740 RepID=A0A238YRP0_9FLAO|nr:tetratricopeptide repeat-containing sensor histidine kinase [Lutibacter agarilyticus]SNR73642.1 Signal transduction histidine kinase [Lutibacter agarilyticus]